MTVDPLNLLVIQLALMLIALFAAAAVYDFVTFRRRRKNSGEAIYRCDACRHIYIAPGRMPLARCPKCGKQNEPVRG